MRRPVTCRFFAIRNGPSMRSEMNCLWNGAAGRRGVVERLFTPSERLPVLSRFGLGRVLRFNARDEIVFEKFGQ